MSYDYNSNRLIPRGSAYARMLDNAGPRSLMKIYCSCGRIVDLDRKVMAVKRSLKKDVECTVCRNARISMEIDLLNDCFAGVSSAEEDPQY